MPITDDPNDPRLERGGPEPGPQNEVYLVLSEQERAKGFRRPLRASYIHVGPAAPKFELHDLDEEQTARYCGTDFNYGYVKYEPYPPDDLPMTGRYWTQAQLDAIGTGCKQITTMGRDLAETYAREPGFYSATYCVTCRKHLPVDEFIWAEDGERVGT